MSTPRTNASSFPAFIAAAAVAGGIFIVPLKAAQAADVKLVVTTTMTTTGQQAGMMGGKGNRQFTTTTYIKGSKTRTESGPGSVTISDTATGNVYTLNPTSKTYTVTNLNSALDQAQGMMAMMDFKATGGVTPGGKTKTILGKPAKNYLVSTKITMGLKTGAKPGGASAPLVKPGVPLMTMNIKGEQWATEAVSMPSNSGLANLRMINSGLSRMPGLEKFAATMSKIKGLPLEGISTQQMQMNMAAAMGGGATPGAKVPPAQQTVITIKTEPVSLSEAPLPASLFAIPAGYQKVTPPARRPMMGGGGARPMSAN